MVRTVTMWTQSGGGGKSTVTMNTAHALEKAGHDVLVWDIDPQRQSLTDYIGMTEYLSNDRANALEAVFDGDLNDVILSKERHDELPFDLIPSSFQWSDFDKVLARERVPNEWTVFRQALVKANIPDYYDVLFIDCEGRKGLKERNALIATQNVIVPVFPNRKGRTDVKTAQEYLFNRTQPALADAGIDIEFDINAVVATQVDYNKSIHQDNIGYFQNSDEIPLFPHVFKDRGPYEQAMEEQMTLFEFAESDETRDLYDYEPEVLEKYHYLAQAIMVGDLNIEYEKPRVVA